MWRHAFPVFQAWRDLCTEFLIFGRRYCEEDFTAPRSENPHRDYGLAGDLEIMFGLLVFAQGDYVSSCMLPVWAAPVFYPLKGALFRLVRFFSNVARIKRNGHV